MQRAGEAPITITLEDAVVIMTNQQKTIEELIANNQRMFQYIQEAQRMGGGFGNIQFAQQNLSDPASHVYGGGAPASTPVREKPMTLNEYLALKKAGGAGAGAGASAGASAIPAPSTLSAPPSTLSAAPSTPSTAPMTLSEFLAQRKASSAAPAAAPAAPDTVPVFDTPSKTEPVPL